MRALLRLSFVLTLALVPACGSDDEDSGNNTTPDAGAGGTGGSAGTGGQAGAGATGGAAGSAGASASGGAAGSAGASGSAGSADAGSDASDAGSDAGSDADAGPDVPLEGMGEIAGQCGVLDDDEWNASAPFLFRNAIDFGTEGLVESELSAGGAEILADGNLNQGSLLSEVVAYEALYRCELAELIKSEGEVDYVDPDGKKTDVLAWIDGRKVGVSVTRAYHYPPSDPYTVAEATVLLNSKLADLPLSAANAEPHDAWERSMLHVVAYDASYADSIESAWAAIDDAVRGDAILVVTVTDGDDAFIY